jgi:hypothetical protein
MSIFTPTFRRTAILAAPILGAFFLTVPSAEPQKMHDVTIMGCVSQGDGPHQYVMQDQNKKYVLVSENHRYKLSKYVGQKISVSGSMESVGPDTERFKVHALSRVAKTCD